MKTFDASTFSSSTSVPADVSGDKAHSRTPPAKRGFYARFGKRALDIVMALLALPLLAPIIGVLWLMVRRDGGPGFYTQARVGLDGREFTCWKLRTMVMDAERVLTEMCEKDPAIAEEWHRNQKLAVDPRITRVGAFLRATSLDELPQIWNVLLGDMSFIGPRPFMVTQEPLYRASGGEAYFHMRPGITGPWQIVGRGETTFVQRIRYDNLYWRQLSLSSDLWYIWKTIRILLLERTGH